MASPFQLGTLNAVTGMAYSYTCRCALLFDGSILTAGMTATSTETLWQVTNPGTPAPTITALSQTFADTGSTNLLTDIWVTSTATSSDVWVVYQSNASGTAACHVAHATYNGSTFTWDNTGTTAVSGVSAGSGLATICWTGANLIVVFRDNSFPLKMVWTATKNGSAGWSTASQLNTATASGSHTFPILVHDANLGGAGAGCTACVYTISTSGANGAEELGVRTLLDSAASPAIANWSAEVLQGATNWNFGLATIQCCVNSNDGTLHVGFNTSAAGTGGSGNLGLHHVPITISGAGTPTWGTLTSILATTSPGVGLGVDVLNKLYLFYATGAIGSAGVVNYRTSIDGGSTWSGAIATVAATTGDGYPHVPCRGAGQAMSGYVPLAFQRGTATFTAQFDNTILAGQKAGVSGVNAPSLMLPPTVPGGLAPVFRPPSQVAGVTTNQALSATLSFTGSIVKAPSVAKSATLSFVGTGLGFQIGPGLFVSTQTQTGISGGPPGNNTTETDVSWQDGSGNGWQVGMIPAYGGALVCTWYEIAAGVVGVEQNSLATSVSDGFIHCLAQAVGGTFGGTEDLPYTLTENGPVPATPGGIWVRRYYDSGTMGSGGGGAPGLNYRVRTVMQPGDPGFMFHRIDLINPGGTTVSLASSDSLEVAMIGGLIQAQQGSANPAWAPANGKYALVGGAETTWPGSLTTANPDYIYISPAAGSGLTQSVFCVKQTGLVEAAGVTSGQVEYLQNSARLKFKLQGTLTTFPASTTYSMYFVQGFRRNLAAGEVNSIAADLLNPDGAGAFSVGTFTSYSYDEGAYVVAAASNQIAVTHTMTGNVTKRWLPSYKITGYTATGSPKLVLANVHLVWGTDYIAVVDTANQIAYVKLLKTLVPSGAGAGQLNNGLLSMSPAGGFSQALSATLSFTGSLGRQLTRALSGTLSFTGSQSRSVGAGKSATLSFTGSQSRAVNTGLAGATLSFVGSLPRATAHLLSSATLSFVGSFARALNFSRSLTATLSFVGSLAKATSRPFAATLSFVGSQVRSVGKGLSATLTFVGSQARATSHALVSATLTFVGSLASGKQFFKTFSATLTFVGSQARSVGKALSASLTFTGSQVRSVAHGLAATLTFTGSIAKSLARSLAGAILGFAGSLASGHAYSKALSATLSFVGSQTHQASKALTATLTFIGSQARSAAKGMSAGLTFAGSQARSVARGFSATLTFVGSQARSLQLSRSLSATLSFTGSLPRQVSTRLASATLSFTGIFGRLNSKAFTATLTFVGNFTHSIPNQPQVAYTIRLWRRLSFAIFGRR